MTPGLSRRLETVCQTLLLPERAVDAFIYASPEVQAECYASGTEGCTLRFSSALVDLLDDDEFEFVCGHEAGHFLLGHGLAGMEGHSDSLEYFMQQRAQEISVDRIGLIACGSLEVSIRAMMKIVSGLSGEHLRYDVGAFLRQLDDSPQRAGDAASTHPSIFVRCRALLWFSLNDSFNRGDLKFKREDLLRLDKHIERDIAKFVDGPARRIIDDAKKDLMLWAATNHCVQNGILNKKEQAAIAEMVGMETLTSLKNFLSDISASDVQVEVYQRMKTARENLERLLPSSFEKTVHEIEEKVAKMLG